MFNISNIFFAARAVLKIARGILVSFAIVIRVVTQRISPNKITAAKETRGIFSVNIYRSLSHRIGDKLLVY